MIRRAVGSPPAFRAATCSRCSDEGRRDQRRQRWRTGQHALATSPGACFREAPGDHAAQSPVRLAVAGNVAQIAVGTSRGWLLRLGVPPVKIMK
jgi:hypothetical protein